MNEQLLHDAHSVFCRVFHSNMPYEAFRHKHMDNPDRDPDIMTLVHYRGDIPVGTSSYMGCWVVDGKQAYYSVMSCDNAVIEEARGEGVFSRLVQRAISGCQEKETPFLSVFPNLHSRPGFAKLGFLEAGMPETYAVIPRPVHLLLRKTLGRTHTLPLFRPFSGREGEWTLSLRCPFTEEDLALINSRFDIHLQRSLPFYQWKIDCMPEGEASYLCLRQEGRLEAFLVLRRYANNACFICDWMLPEDKAACRGLLKQAIRLLRPFCDLLEVRLVNPTGMEPAQLSAGGFFRKKSMPVPFMIYPTASLGEEDRIRLMDLRNWTLRYIDCNTVLNRRAEI